MIEMLCFIKQCVSIFISGNKWWSTKVDANLLSDLVIFSIFYSDITLDFHEPIQLVLLKYLMYFLAVINTK